MLNVKVFSAKNKKFAKQINWSKNWPLSQIFCENAEKDSKYEDIYKN